MNLIVYIPMHCRKYRIKEIENSSSRQLYNSAPVIISFFL